jgi:hypothetical protein
MASYARGDVMRARSIDWLVSLVALAALLALAGAARSQGGVAKQDGPSSIAPDPGPGMRVLRVAEEMIVRRRIVRGSCYDYVSTVFEEAGYPSGRREQVFRSDTGGPYADRMLIQPGDWLAIVNHPERDPVGTHSVIFVRWTDAERGEAMVVSYAGNDELRPGAMVEYDLTRTYRITRATDAPPD